MSESGMCERIYMGGWVHECTCCSLCLAERTGMISFLRLMKMKNWTFALEMM